MRKHEAGILAHRELLANCLEAFLILFFLRVTLEKLKAQGCGKGEWVVYGEVCTADCSGWMFVCRAQLEKKKSEEFAEKIYWHPTLFFPSLKQSAFWPLFWFRSKNAISHVATSWEKTKQKMS